MKRTLVMIKPDGVRKNLVGEVIKRFENTGLKVVALKMLQLDRAKAEELYAVHKGKDFFCSLVDFVTSSPVVVMVLEGEEAISKVREEMGATDPRQAAKGTIRGDFAQEIEENIVHGSDSKATADYEIPVFFNNEEIFSKR